MARRAFTDAARRARLVTRHHLDGSARDAVAAVHAVVAMHSSDPATPHLGVLARIGSRAYPTLDVALHEDRRLWRLHGMRRTLFVVTTEDAPIVSSAVGRDVARAERAKLVGRLAEAGPPADDPSWLRAVEERTLAAMGDAVELRVQELTERVPELATRITVGSGRWTADVSLGSRLLLLLALDGQVVRAHPVGTWRSGQYRWARVADWFGAVSVEIAPDLAWPALARRYLEAHGPATAADLRWWSGWTAARTRAALTAVGAVEVELDGGGRGHVLPGDVEDPEPTASGGEPVVCLLPGLDPTPMGWKERAWYLGDHDAELFDRNGNIGPTVWVDGRIVGGWAQRPDGEVVSRLLEPVSPDARDLIEARAAAVTRWLDGVVVIPRFRTPLERTLTGS